MGRFFLPPFLNRSLFNFFPKKKEKFLVTFLPVSRKRYFKIIIKFIYIQETSINRFDDRKYRDNKNSIHEFWKEKKRKKGERRHKAYSTLSFSNSLLRELCHSATINNRSQHAFQNSTFTNFEKRKEKYKNIYTPSHRISSHPPRRNTPFLPLTSTTTTTTSHNFAVSPSSNNFNSRVIMTRRGMGWEERKRKEIKEAIELAELYQRVVFEPSKPGLLSPYR